ncbi:DUF4158 domain-containing protein [Streptomyces sp. NPDC056660]|uniref:DUF4158 domain-containing protein n=1 Tax=Streptomyces sp. NPDC056660 TaxID=3345897 RepID=UPI0036CE708C
MDRTAYPRFKRMVSGRELVEAFSPTTAEVPWARGKNQNEQRLPALVVRLKSYRRLGCFPKLTDVPAVAATIRTEVNSGFFETVAARPDRAERARLRGSARGTEHRRPTGRGPFWCIRFPPPSAPDAAGGWAVARRVTRNAVDADSIASGASSEG